MATSGANLAGENGPKLRKARDFCIDLPHQPGQAHRSAAGKTIDYQLQEITGDAARSISTVPGHFKDKPTFGSPWHYHDCALQVAVVLEGSIELGYRGGRYARAGKGDVLFIPGHTMHDVSAPSSDYQVAEITFPGTFGTTEAVEPAFDVATPARTLGTADAVRHSVCNGLIRYDYPVGGGLEDKFAIRRILRSRVDEFEAGLRSGEGRFAFALVLQGWREVEIDDDVKRAEMGDLLVLPGSSSITDMACSDDYESIEVILLT